MSILIILYNAEFGFFRSALLIINPIKIIIMFGEDIPLEIVTSEVKETEVEIIKRKKSKQMIPSSDVDLMSLARIIAGTWATKDLPLQWLTPEEFNTIVDTFENALKTKNTATARRNPVTMRIRELSKIIDVEIEHIKNYLAEKYGKSNAKSYYAKFGITKTSQAYKLPRDQEFKIVALEQLLQGIDTEGFTEKTYGAEFWQAIYDEYKTLVNSVTDNIINVSEQVGTKKTLRADIKEVLNSLIFLIKAHNPKNYTSELRVWGFHKEKY